MTPASTTLPLNVHQHTVEIEHNDAHGLFATEAQTLSERRDARRASLVERVRECARIVNADAQPWVVWCDLNAEGDALTAAIDGAVQISGADDTDAKERRLHDFAAGNAFGFVSPSICGGLLGGTGSTHPGMAFVGVTDSRGGLPGCAPGIPISAKPSPSMCMSLPEP